MSSATRLWRELRVLSAKFTYRHPWSGQAHLEVHDGQDPAGYTIEEYARNWMMLDPCGPPGMYLRVQVSGRCKWCGDRRVADVTRDRHRRKTHGEHRPVLPARLSSERRPSIRRDRLLRLSGDERVGGQLHLAAALAELGALGRRHHHGVGSPTAPRHGASTPAASRSESRRRTSGSPGPQPRRVHRCIPDSAQRRSRGVHAVSLRTGTTR